MQGWFSHTLNFLPNSNIHPIWLGTHIAPAIYKYIQEVLAINPQYFRESVGCRDLSTFHFLDQLGIDSYFSRCLTLTLPKRTEGDKHDKVYFVDIPANIINLFPKQLKERGIIRNQKWIHVGNENWMTTYNHANKLLEDMHQAQLVITSALHCAAPCIAMGIPVILISLNPTENINRFTALNGIINIKTINDLANNNINYDAVPINIESLKKAMLINLSLTVRRSVGFTVSDREIKEVREYIANFKVS